MKNGKRSFLYGLFCLGVMAAMLLSFPGVSHAYTYKNSEFLFQIECPEPPRQVLPVNSDDRGVALDFSPHEKQLNVWMVQVRKDSFVNPRQLSAEEREKLLAELLKADYGSDKICETSSFVKVGKYEGVMLLIRHKDQRLAISLVQTDRGYFMLTLLGSLADKEAFGKNLQLYKKGLVTFQTL